MEAIVLNGLTKAYKDVVAVKNVNLRVEKGELFALLGINGAGKTTTIKMLSCLIKPTSGDAYLLGKSIVSEPIEVKAMLGISPQETAVATNLSVKENLELMCGVHGFSKEKTKEETDRLLREFSLEEIQNKRAGKLSGGWQRRLSIAMALIGEPKILFLDEPTLGLDVIARRELWETIRALKGKMTIVLTTHYMEEAESLSDRIGIMKNGELIALGNLEELTTRTGTQSLEEAFIALVKEVKL